MDVDTFVTELYVRVDDHCKREGCGAVRRGPAPALCASEVITLALLGRWDRFRSERGYWRWACRHLRGAFPRLGSRSQFNRQVRRQGDTICRLMVALAQELDAERNAYEALDCTAVPTRNAKRRRAGWLAGEADIGYSNRLGWFHGLRLLLATGPSGVITGFGFGPGSAKDQPLAETLFALRQQPNPRLPSVGRSGCDFYVVDTGFEGQARHAFWQERFGLRVVCMPRPTSDQPGTAAWRRWQAGLRQIVESVFDKLHHLFGLDTERPHDISGFYARLAARAALHNFCFWLNRKLSRPPLAFVDLIDW